MGVDQVTESSWCGTTLSDDADRFAEIIDVPCLMQGNWEMSCHQKQRLRDAGWSCLTGEQISGGEQEEGDAAIIENADPSRLHARVYLKLPRCLEAIEKEMNGLTSKDAHGIPSIIAVQIDGEKYKHLPVAHSALLVKKKNPKLYKARLCLRGDEVKIVPRLIRVHQPPHACHHDYFC